jgi:hypothetical protein
LAVLEAVGHKLGFMNGTRTRGRKPDRIAEAYPELQKYVHRRKITLMKENSLLINFECVHLAS